MRVHTDGKYICEGLTVLVSFKAAEALGPLSHCTYSIGLKFPQMHSRAGSQAMLAMFSPHYQRQCVSECQLPGITSGESCCCTQEVGLVGLERSSLAAAAFPSEKMDPFSDFPPARLPVAVHPGQHVAFRLLAPPLRSKRRASPDGRRLHQQPPRY